MRNSRFYMLPILLIVWSCSNSQEKQNADFAFTLTHKKTEKSKDSNKSTKRYTLQGNKLIVTNQYQGGRRGKKNEFKTHQLSTQDLEGIKAYFAQNNFYRDIDEKGKPKVSPGIFREVSLKITQKTKTYNLSYAGGYRFGERSRQSNKTYKQLIKFESFLRKMLRK